MNIVSSLLVALGLSMDNLAVALSAGCAPGLPKRGNWQVSGLFALAHFGMFALGYLGLEWVPLNRVCGAWIACGVLVGIGGRMVWESTADLPARPHLLDKPGTQLVLAVATSLDALFVGGSLGLVHAPFWQTQALLVVCVFITSAGGFYIGNLLGKTWGKRMEIAGGILLMGVGVKVLLEGIGIW